MMQRGYILFRKTSKLIGQCFSDNGNCVLRQVRLTFTMNRGKEEDVFYCSALSLFKEKCKGTLTEMRLSDILEM